MRSSEAKRQTMFNVRPYDPSTCGAEAASGMHLRPVACTFSHLRGVST